MKNIQVVTLGTYEMDVCVQRACLRNCRPDLLVCAAGTFLPIPMSTGAAIISTCASSASSI